MNNRKSRQPSFENPKGIPQRKATPVSSALRFPTVVRFGRRRGAIFSLKRFDREISWIILGVGYIQFGRPPGVSVKICETVHSIRQIDAARRREWKIDSGAPPPDEL
ncbi:hypothetical protein [Ensifer adhaerens]|uniref:hypothetical protein n=1 Tax=Ensifer adhaerens TaxID=106592 RepID=UPI0011786FE5|nr:hypothetical protein [Ensifer adhaerens]